MPGQKQKVRHQQVTSDLSVAPPLAALGASSGLEPKATGWVNRDSPDPEGPPEPPKFQQLAVFYASSCHPMLGFAGFHAVLCRTLLAQMSEFAGPSAEHARPATTFTRHRT
jgi:hypothetical protein